MSGNWTPGPWAATSAAHPEQGVYGSGYRLAKMTGGEFQRDRANARLIAAAPDMADAMAEFCRRVEAGEIRSRKTYAQFITILAKARGETK